MTNSKMNIFDSDYINCYNNIRGDRLSQLPIIIQKIKEQFENPKIVDFGCGFGRIAIPLSKIFGHVHCVENNSFALDFLNELIKKQNISISLQKFDLNNDNYNLIPKADVCILSHVIHWIGDIEYLIKNIKICLRENGIFIISFYSRANLNKMLLYKLLGRELLKIQKKTTPSISELRRKLIFNGFRITDIISNSETVNYDKKVIDIIDNAGLLALKVYKEKIKESDYHIFKSKVEQNILKTKIVNPDLSDTEVRTMIIAKNLCN